MANRQRQLTEELLFNYYMISSKMEEEIYSPFPFCLKKNLFYSMVNATEILDGLVNRILQSILEGNLDIPFEMGDFPLMDRIVQGKGKLLPFFWCRYDAFIREKGGIFFSEFNYDKPCAQREIAASYKLFSKNSPNGRFIEAFKKGIIFLWEEFTCKKYNIEHNPLIAILVSPNHYEELHLAYLYSEWLNEIGFTTIIAGDKNFCVEDGFVKAFDKKVDIILRQFPTEYLHEVNDFDKILSLSDEGKILIINDPRAIIAQVKSLFEYLWRLVEENSYFLNKDEKRVIKATIPYTTMFNEKLTDRLYREKDSYVIKSIYGRYSEEVYIGCMYSNKEWEEIIHYVAESEKPHLVQEFCAIKKERVFKAIGNGYKEVEGFCNFGVYLTLGKFSGLCTRWSENYLTRDDSVWISPVVISEERFYLLEQNNKFRNNMWNEINEEAMFRYQYTGGYNNLQESFTIDSIIFNKNLYEEIKNATNAVIQLFIKTRNFVKQNSELICPALGISDNITGLIMEDSIDLLCFIGRFDWVVDCFGNLKLLEFNSETPAGLMESTVLNKLIYNKFYKEYLNPNKDLEKDIRRSFINIIESYRKKYQINNIGFISTIYYEDMYNTSIILDILKDLPYNFIHGEVSGLKVQSYNKLSLYGNMLDAVYRYYPLDWFEEDPYYKGVIECFTKRTLSINPISTYITQSKAFLALIWELKVQNFYSTEEQGIIERYIPKTTLSPKGLDTEDYCVKPFYGREGENIKFNYGSSINYNKESDVIFQERVDIQPIKLKVYNTTKNVEEIMYPVIGAYVAGNKFSGIYTRVGDRITDKWAVYLPTYIER